MKVEFIKNTKINGVTYLKGNVVEMLNWQVQVQLRKKNIKIFGVELEDKETNE